MRYMGGKFRQSKAIAQYINSIKPQGEWVYVEPFCGGMWSACRVINDCKPTLTMLNDANRPLMLLWQRCVEQGVDWLPVDAQEVENNYQSYKTKQDENDPLTAWYGIALSFGGKWFGGVARHTRGQQETSYEAERKSMYKKIDALRNVETWLNTGSYCDLDIPDNAVVYCDPPYEGRTKAHHFDSFNYNQFWQWVRDLSKRCTVVTSCFDCPDDFDVVYQWGDTVTRHLNSKGSDGTCEKLVVFHAS